MYLKCFIILKQLRQELPNIQRKQFSFSPVLDSVEGDIRNKVPGYGCKTKDTEGPNYELNEWITKSHNQGHCRRFTTTPYYCKTFVGSPGNGMIHLRFLISKSQKLMQQKGHQMLLLRGPLQALIMYSVEHAILVDLTRQVIERSLDVLIVTEVMLETLATSAMQLKGNSCSYIMSRKILHKNSRY